MLKDKDIKFYKHILLAAAAVLIVFASAETSAAQDLGSSNGLFNAANPKTKIGAAKTKAGKPAAKKSANAAAPVAVKKAAAKSKAAAAASRTAQQNNAKSKAAKVVAASGKGKSAKTAASKSAEAAKALLQKEVVDADAQPSEKVAAIEAPAAPPSIAAPPPPPAPKNDYDESFERAIDEGNAARDSRQYVRAEAAYLRGQSIKTKDSRAVYGLGNLYADQQRWEEAERAYRAAMLLEPTSPDAFVALSFVLTQPIAGNNLTERYSEAEKTARRAIALDSANAVAYDQLGVALELGGGVGDETRAAYRKAIELEPTFALAYAHLGRLLRRTGLNGESDAAYLDAIRLATDVPTMILVADVMQSQQKYKESEQLLRQAVKQDPKNPTALYLLGRALTTRGAFDEAEKILKKSAEVSPNSFVAYSLLGSLFLRREKFDDAEKYLMKALPKVSPNEKKRLAQDFETVGDGFARVGKNKDAARVYTQAVALDKEKAALADKLVRARN